MDPAAKVVTWTFLVTTMLSIGLIVRARRMAKHAAKAVE
jgi:hypothetical protein